MSGGTRYVHTDSDPLFTGTHDGPDGAGYLQDMGAMFKSLGAIVGLYVENATQGTNDLLVSSTDDRVYTGDIFEDDFPFEFSLSWDNGDTYNIYKTGTKGSTISGDWVDVSRGWRAEKRELVNGWFPDDVDIPEKTME
jgi:hypothetical protein